MFNVRVFFLKKIEVSALLLGFKHYWTNTVSVLLEIVLKYYFLKTYK